MAHDALVLGADAMTVPHLFLTRFNVPTNRVESAIYSDSWLRDRIALFERYTLPSVRAQSPSERYWLVYLGADSPTWLRVYMERLQHEGLLQPRYLSERLTETQIKSDIQEVTGREAGPVVTSNLDNDDGLAVDYVERLRGIGTPERQAVLYLDVGLIVQGRWLYRRVDRSNAFSAVRGDLGREDFRSCWSEWHNRLARVMPAEHAQGAPAWLQVIHGANVSNRVRGRLTGTRPYRGLFPEGVLDGIADPSTTDLLEDRLVRSPGRSVRDAARSRAAAIARTSLGTERYDRLKFGLTHRLTRSRAETPKSRALRGDER